MNVLGFIRQEHHHSRSKPSSLFAACFWRNSGPHFSNLLSILSGLCGLSTDLRGLRCKSNMRGRMTLQSGNGSCGQGQDYFNSFMRGVIDHVNKHANSSNYHTAIGVIKLLVWLALRCQMFGTHSCYAVLFRAILWHVLPTDHGQ